MWGAEADVDVGGCILFFPSTLFALLSPFKLFETLLLFEIGTGIVDCRIPHSEFELGFEVGCFCLFND